MSSSTGRPPRRPAARVPRLHVEAELRPGSEIPLPEGAAHHVLRVLRLQDGDAAVLFDGRGGEFDTRLRVPGRGRVLAEVGTRREVERESPLHVTLIQALSSADRMDFTIQKAVELGVAAIHPVFSDKSVVRLDEERGAKKLAHWRRVAAAACEQCGRNRIPEILEPVALARYAAPAAVVNKILLSPAAAETLAGRARGPLALAVGPEAGFSDAEEGGLRRRGFVAVRLGPRTLRTETAALAALAALNALAGDF